MAFFRRAQASTPGAAVAPPARSAALPVSPDRALTLGAIYRCVTLYENAVSQLPLVVRRGDDILDSRLAKRPDVELTYSEFMAQTTVSLMLHGEAFWLLTRTPYDDAVVNVKVVRPIDVGIEETRDGRLRYQYRGEYTRRIKHLRLSTKPGEYRGYGPIQASWPDIASVLRLREYSDAFYNVGQPIGVLSSDQVLNREQANEYRDAWAATMQERTVAVLGQGLSYAPIFGDAVQSQLIDANRQAITSVARLFGVPAQLLASGVEGSSLTYSTTESLMQAWLATGLVQPLNVIEEHFSDLLPRGQDARFKVDAILRSDRATRIAGSKTLVDIGAITPQEVRLEEGYDPQPVGEYATPDPAPAATQEATA